MAVAAAWRPGATFRRSPGLRAACLPTYRGVLIMIRSDPIAWTRIGKAIARISLARAYRFELLQRDEVSAIVTAVKSWFPEISVGSASCYLREGYFRVDVYFDGEPEKDVLVVLIKKGHEVAGLFSCERDRSTLSLYARLGVIAPEHRG